MLPQLRVMPCYDQAAIDPFRGQQTKQLGLGMMDRWKKRIIVCVATIKTILVLQRTVKLNEACGRAWPLLQGMNMADISTSLSHMLPAV